MKMLIAVEASQTTMEEKKKKRFSLLNRSTLRRGVFLHLYVYLREQILFSFSSFYRPFTPVIIFRSFSVVHLFLSRAGFSSFATTDVMIYLS
ncbi:hypothetical protein CSUI_000371 [Cystoisospora suis]|uniref:Uncharacterized protein n=1 Tax=Cystoisospora suis TaxID=483139 RepID=A0A2C6LH27_9APIC|nr:hypothetical protein CSUI_000371 [Cystoisospora suis]